MERDKDIVRSDEEIKQTIVKELTADKRIDPAKVEIEVNNGKVTLRGDVPDATAQSSANWIATAVPGVTDVINQFSVREPATLTMAGDKKKRDRSHQAPGTKTSYRFNVEEATETEVVSGAVPV